jgi:hypothetical protein
MKRVFSLTLIGALFLVYMFSVGYMVSLALWVAMTIIERL